MFAVPYIFLMFQLSILIMLETFADRIDIRTALLDLLIVPLVLVGAWTASRGRRRRAARAASGHCVKCGYDLRGDVSGRCPECAEPRTVKVARAKS